TAARTLSLKLALERLGFVKCYHMFEVLEHPEHIPAWHAASFGNMPDWHELFDGFAAAVDWPASAFWPELSEAFPEASCHSRSPYSIRTEPSTTASRVDHLRRWRSPSTTRTIGMMRSAPVSRKRNGPTSRSGTR
ncbi:MAG: hypothetical protein IH806_06020, partial [Proteobacteria bacterium]|nr:hypothetical protein [Pseudomonadota bacterium]